MLQLLLQLTFLTVSGNKLSGTLPSSWGKFTQASHVARTQFNIDLRVQLPWCSVATKHPNACCASHHVSFDNPMPMQMSNLDLSRNRLMGILPESWGNITYVSSPLTMYLG